LETGIRVNCGSLAEFVDSCRCAEDDELAQLIADFKGEARAKESGEVLEDATSSSPTACVPLGCRQA
jgi:hypothetical protein